MLSVLPVFIRLRQRGRRLDDRVYLWLMIFYCLWLITFSVLFFSEAFVRPLPKAVTIIFGILRGVITITVLTLFTFLTGETSGRLKKRSSVIISAAAALVYIILVIPVFASSSVFFANLVTLLFNLYFLTVSVFVLIVLRNKKSVQKSFIYFFSLMVIYSLSQAVIIFLPPANLSMDIRLVLAVLPRAAFCLLWGAVELVVFIRREYIKELEHHESVSSVFIRDYEITARETDVIKCISAGYSNKQTAEELFISEKTIETHIYSIYRKCRVKNKVELLNLISRSR